MSDAQRKATTHESLPSKIVREAKMPAYHYQSERGGSGSLSSTGRSVGEKKELRNLSFNILA